MQINKILICFVVSVFLIAQASASLGTFKQNSCVNIQTILNTPEVTISTILYPDSSVALSNQVMEKNGMTFNYTFCDTSRLGTYIYDYYDADGSVYVNDFKITPSGIDDNTSFLLFFIGIIIFIFILGFVLRNSWVMMLGSILVIIFGFYIIANGITFVKDTTSTWAIGFIMWALGIYFLFISVEEQLKEWG